MCGVWKGGCSTRKVYNRRDTRHEMLRMWKKGKEREEGSNATQEGKSAAKRGDSRKKGYKENSKDNNRSIDEGGD